MLCERAGADLKRVARTLDGQPFDVEVCWRGCCGCAHNPTRRCWQVKYDGERVQCHFSRRGEQWHAEYYSRNGIDYSRLYGVCVSNSMAALHMRNCAIVVRL